jgi:hypothetical protein
MGTKATGNYTQPAAIRKVVPDQPALDDDLRWLSDEAAHQRLTERFSDTAFSPIVELMKALAEGRLPCMARSATGERKLIEPAEWVDQIMLESTSKGARVIYSQPLYQSPGGSYVVNPVRGWDFFVWQPDFDRIWPPPADSAPVEHDNDSDTPPRVTPGPKPREDWPKLIGRWLIEVAVEDKRRLQNIDALVVEAQNFLDNQIRWSPSNTKRLRAVIVEWLTPVRR